MKHQLASVIACLASFGILEGSIVFQDTFDVADSADLNHETAARTSGGQFPLNWNVYFDTTQNAYYSISGGELLYDGPGGGTAHPDKLFISNPNTGARINFQPYLTGLQYQIQFSVTTTGTDGTDQMGFTIADDPTGGINGVLSVRQLVSRSIVDVIENGVRVSRVDSFTAGEKVDIRIAVDETGLAPVYEVFRNDISLYSGSFTVASPDRYIFLQIVDLDRDGSALIDNVSITAIPEPATIVLGMGIVTLGMVMLRRRRQ